MPVTIFILAQMHHKTQGGAPKQTIPIDDAIKSDRIKPNEGMRRLNEYERRMQDHTYLTFG